MRPLFSLPLPDALITALTKNGFQTIEDLAGSDKGCHEGALDIIKTAGFSWEDIKPYTLGIGSVSAAQILRKEQFNEGIPTFSEALDKILGGGVQTDSILQICGPPGSGKTQLALQLCINVQIPISLGGLGAESVFIDSEGTFNTNRLKEIACGASEHCKTIAKLHKIKDDIDNFTSDFMMSNIHYIGIGNMLQFISSVQKLNDLLNENRNIKLIVFDSFTFPFLKMANILERTRYISNILQDLCNLATEYNIAIVVTNHLTTKILQENKILAPALGESFTHMIPNTLLLGSVDEFFSAVMYKSCRFKEEVVHFKITLDGIRDV